ncbi:MULTISPECIES: sigma-70 family RNA polymerase sigma factor [unclassified Corynebacterium]|uniref:sigma-70 family RNA polymerase sigma factor n=1 Tax=unclassified Corynebacterium TaxID=2624378 RepID=UPI00309B37AB
MNFGGRVTALSARVDHKQSKSVRVRPAAGAAGDTELLDAHVAGDMRAFGRLMHKYQRQLQWLARNYSYGDADASDALQDAWFKAMTKAHSYRGDAEVSTWLNRIVVNTCRDRLRRRCEHTHGGVDDIAAMADAEQFRQGTSDPTLLLTMHSALRRLSADQRIVVQAVDVMGFSVAEAAQVFGVAEGTIKSRRARARVHMREYLSG